MVCKGSGGGDDGSSAGVSGLRGRGRGAGLRGGGGVGWGWGGPEELVCSSPCVHEGRRGARGAAPGGEGSSGSVSGLLALFRGGFSRAPAACGLGCTLSCCAEARGRSCARSASVRHLPAGLGRSPCRQVRSCKASGLKALL